MKHLRVLSILGLVILAGCSSTPSSRLIDPNANGDGEKDKTAGNNSVISCNANESLGLEDCTSDFTGAHLTKASKAKFCNSTGDGYIFEVCLPQTCENGFEIKDVQCVAVAAIPNLCTPNASLGTQACSIANAAAATQTKSCNAAGNAYVFGTCTLGSCNANYQPQGNTCVATIPAPTKLELLRLNANANLVSGACGQFQVNLRDASGNLASKVSGNTSVTISPLLSATANFYTDTSCTSLFVGSSFSVSIPQGQNNITFGYKRIVPGQPAAPVSTTLRAASSGLASADLAFAETYGVPTKIQFTQQANFQNGSSLQAFSVQPIVTLFDDFGNKSQFPTKDITLEAYDSTCSAAAASPLTGTLTRTTSIGVAAFSDIGYRGTQSFRIKATGASLTSVCSDSIAPGVQPVCDALSVTSIACTIANGTGSQSKTCNSTGTDFALGACAPVSCNANFHTEGNACVATIPAPEILEVRFYEGRAYNLGACSEARLNLRLASSVTYTPAVVDTLARVSTDPTGVQFYSDISCSNVITPTVTGEVALTMPQGQSYIPLYFKNVTYNHRSGSGFNTRFHAESTGLAAANTTLVQTLGSQQKLAFSRQPSNQNSTIPFSLGTQPIIDTLDANDNLVASPVKAITLLAYTDALCTILSPNALTGTTTIDTSGGSATFTNIGYTGTQDFFVKASSPNLQSDCSRVVSTHICDANSVASMACVIPNGTGSQTQTCNSTGTDYTRTTCTVANCNPGFNPVGNLCMLTPEILEIRFYDWEYQTVGACVEARANLRLASSEIYTPALADTLVRLSSVPNSDVEFYADSSCSQIITKSVRGDVSITIPQGQSGVPFHFKRVNYDHRFEYGFYTNLYAESDNFLSIVRPFYSYKVGAPYSLHFFRQPSSFSSPSPSITLSPIATQPIVEIVDSIGNLVRSPNQTVTLEAYSDEFCTTRASSALTGTSSVGSNGGDATFANIGYSGTRSFYLKATAPTLVSACSELIVTACRPNENIDSSDCRLEIANAASATKYRYCNATGDNYSPSACTLQTCNANFKVLGNACVPISPVPFAVTFAPVGHSTIAGSCQMLRVELKNQDGDVIPAPSALDLSFQIQNSPGGALFSDTSCNNLLSKSGSDFGPVRMDAGQSAIPVFYKNTDYDRTQLPLANQTLVQVRSGSLRSDSVSFLEGVGAPERLGFFQQPVRGLSLSESPFTTQPMVEILDHYGNRVRSETTTISLSARLTSNCSDPLSDARLTGATTLRTELGLATFMGIGTENDEELYFIKAEAGGDLAPGCSKSIGAAGVSSRLTAGQYHTCAMGEGGKTYCWGSNVSGQVGDGTSGTANNKNVATLVADLPNALAISAGYSHTCALLPTGRIKCWGLNTSGQLGNNEKTGSKLSPVDVRDITNARALASTGSAHSCAILADRTVQCWGLNSSGQVGAGTATANYLVPHTVPNLTNVISIATGSVHTCAVVSSGMVYCWGANASGQLGDGSTAARNAPNSTKPATGITNAIQVSAGESHTCALLSTGTVKCWGAGTYGRLGNGGTATKLVPTDVRLISNIVSISTSGSAHSCALSNTHQMHCWGRNNYGQVGYPWDNLHSVDPQTVAGSISSIETGYNHTCARDLNNQVWCWGLGTSGQLGNTKVQSINNGRSQPVEGLEFAVSIAGGMSGQHTCTVFESGRLTCRGANNNGQLGDGTSYPLNLSTNDDATVFDSGVFTGSNQYQGALNITSRRQNTITAGGRHSCAVMQTGEVRCWGANDRGQLGDESVVEKHEPVLVRNLQNAIFVSSGEKHTCAFVYHDRNAFIDSAIGGIRCWGANNKGQLGDGSTTDRRIVTSVPDISDAVYVSSGTNHTCALLSSGNVKCWGLNDYGQLGYVTAGSFSTTPKRVEGLTGAVSISTGARHSCALLGSGLVKCWGSNDAGQIGNLQEYNGINYLTATAVVNLTGVVAITSGAYNTTVLLSDGSVKFWGYNVPGEFTNINAGNYRSATSVLPGVKGILSISGGAGRTGIVTRRSPSVADSYSIANIFGNY